MEKVKEVVVIAEVANGITVKVGVGMQVVVMGLRIRGLKEVVRVVGVRGRADQSREGNYPEKRVGEKKRKKEGGRGREERKGTVYRCRFHG